MKRKNLFLLLGVVCLYSCGGGSGSIHTSLIPVQSSTNDSGITYLNDKGKVAVETEFSASYFSDGLSRAHFDRMVGYINTKGKVAIDARFYDGLQFSDGLAWVTYENSYPIAINKSGKEKFTLENVLRVNQFSEGLAVFRCTSEDGSTTLYGAVNKSGKTVIAPQTNEFRSFSQGKAACQNSDSYKWGYMDKSGKVVINFQFDEVQDFNENGMACVKLGDNWGVINAKGEYVINPRFNRIWADGDWFMIYENGKVGWCDKKGTYTINPQFDTALLFNGSDLAPVMNDRKWGYVNKKGVVEIPYQFEQATSFINDKVAVVEMGDQFGMIDKKGKYIVNPQYKGVDNWLLRYISTGEKPDDYILSRFFDVEKSVSALKTLITDSGIDRVSYGSTVAEICDKYGLKESSFAKRTGSTTLDRGSLGSSSYTLSAYGMPWRTERKGWYSNYVFVPDYRPEAYVMEITVPFPHTEKTYMLANEIYKEFSGSETFLAAGENYTVEKPDRTMEVSFTDSKVTVQVKPKR